MRGRSASLSRRLPGLDVAPPDPGSGVVPPSGIGSRRDFKSGYHFGRGDTSGAPGGTRTPNIQIRSLTLYPLNYERTLGAY